VALGLAVQVAFIVITVTEMDMMRTIVTRSDKLSLAKVGVPQAQSQHADTQQEILMLLRRLAHLLELLVLSLLELLVLSLLPQHTAATS
jgi:hypothetical protein